MTVTDLPPGDNYAERFHPERHCNVRMMTGEIVLLPYSSQRAVAGIFGSPGDPLPEYEHCCEYHDPDGGIE